MEQNFRITENGNSENFLEFEIKKFSSKRSKRNFRSGGDRDNSLDFFIKHEAEEASSNKSKGIFEVLLNGEVIAFFSFYFINKEIVVRARPEYDETYVYLDNLAVKNEYQDKKIGTNLLEVIIKEFKKVSEKYNCISGMILAPKITELEKFYEKFEFTLFKDYKLDDIKHFGLKF